MMNGVEILFQEEVVVKTVFNWKLVLSILPIIFMVFLVAFGLMQYKENVFKSWKKTIIVTFIAFLIESVFVLPVGFEFDKPKTYKTQYKVTISEEVSMTDFNEKYEILEKEGKIYTIQEKD